MSYRVQLEMPGLPKTPNARMGHWGWAKERAYWRDIVVMLLVSKPKPLKPLEKARVTLTRCSAVEGDYDNRVSSFKGCLDGLKRAGVIKDDKPSVIGIPIYGWERAPRGAGSIKILVEEINEGDKAA